MAHVADGRVDLFEAEKALDGNVLANCLPVNADDDETPRGSLFGRGFEQARKPDERRGNLAPVGERHAQGIIRADYIHRQRFMPPNYRRGILGQSQSEPLIFDPSAPATPRAAAEPRRF